MARKKKRQKRTKRHSRAPLRVLVAKGNDAWQRGRREDALRSWEWAWQKGPSPQLAAALGELYFRRGVSFLIHAEGQDGLQGGLVDLEKAQTLMPDDWRPLYYMGVAHHLLGELEPAQALYQRVLEQKPNSRRAAYRIVLIALEQLCDPTQSQGWALLDKHQQVDLLAAWQLVNSQWTFRNKSKQIPLQADDVHPLWIGLSALNGWRPDKKGAKKALERAMSQENEDSPRFRLAQVHMGSLLWPDEPLAAAHHWVNAAGLGVPKWVDQNQAVGAELLARRALDSGDIDAAFSWACIALDHDPDRSVYQEVMGYVEFHLGNHAAQEDCWDEAVTHWTEAYQLGCKELGLVHNLALGYERLEQWTEAASAWRTFLRRRPRRADAPNALSLQQEIKVRRHIASLFWRAGEEKAALQFYRQALDAQPKDESNAQLRVELADLLASHDRWRQAEQTLREGLRHHPNHSQLLQALGLLYEEQEQGKQAQETWAQLLKIAPDHPIAREHMANRFTQQAWDLERKGHFGKARALYMRAIEYAPQDTSIKLDLADMHHQRGEQDEVTRLVEEILAQSPNSPQVIEAIIRFWVSHDESERADSLLRQAQGSPEERAELYAIVGMGYGQVDQEEKCEALIRQAVQIGQVPHLTTMRVAFALLQNDVYTPAVILLEQSLYELPGEPIASLLLATALALQGKQGRSRQVLKDARYVSRRMGDREAVSMLDDLESMIKSDPAAMLALLELLGLIDEISS